MLTASVPRARPRFDAYCSRYEAARSLRFARRARRVLRCKRIGGERAMPAKIMRVTPPGRHVAARRRLAVPVALWPGCGAFYAIPSFRSITRKEARRRDAARAPQPRRSCNAFSAQQRYAAALASPLRQRECDFQMAAQRDVATRRYAEAIRLYDCAQCVQRVAAVTSR